MAKSFDSEILSKIFLNFVQDWLAKSSKVLYSEPPTTKSRSIVEYQGRMNITAMEKFNGPTYLSAVSFYLNDQDKEKHRAKGALVVYLEASSAEKLLKAFGYTVNDDEEDEEIFNASGKLCVLLADGLKQALSNQGCPPLVLSSPVSDKNNLQDGVDYSDDQSEAQEFSFYFWKKKLLAVDITLAPLPTR